MANVKQDAILGVVFFAAISLLLAVTLLLTDFSLRAKPRMQVRFPSAAGLEKGDAVYVLGRRAGEVVSVAYDPSDKTHRITATLQLDEPVDLRRDKTIEIVETSLLGGKRVDIDPGEESANWNAGEPLLGEVRKSALDALGDEMRDENGLVGRVKQTFGRMNEGQGTFAQFLNSPKLHDALLAALDSLTVSLKAIENGRGVVGRLIHDAAAGDDFTQMVQSLRSAARKVDTGEGPAGVILNDTGVAGNLRTFVADLALVARELRDGEGVAGLLFRDKDARAQVQTILADVRDLIAKTRTPDSGLVWALFSDTQMLADTRGILGAFREFADRASHGNGLLARLVNDEDWGRRFGQILGQVQRAIEDAREAAPVGTFFQVLTGFF